MMQKHVHFIGINGIGMSGLARILLKQGRVTVSGSDLKVDTIGSALRSQGALIYKGHSAENVPIGEVLVVVSSGISSDNPELLRAQELSLPILHRSDLLKMIMQDYTPLLVTGTHGKTTTSSLLTHTLITAQLDPSFAVGGIINNYMTNAACGKGEYFVAEADESDGTFTKYSYHGAIVTNIDTDHLAHFTSMECLEESFKTFVGNNSCEKAVFYCGDDVRLRRLCKGMVSYGLLDHNDVQVIRSCITEDGTTFSIKTKKGTVEDLFIPLYGVHNALNATAVYAMASSLFIPEETIRKAFSTFRGVKRRLEKKSMNDKVVIFDDYGHHPTEIAATLLALKSYIKNRPITAVFQPHRPSRMKYCMDELSTAFIGSEKIIVTDVYRANEVEDTSEMTQKIAALIKKSYPSKQTEYVPREALVSTLSKTICEGDVIIFFGAGDSTQVSEELAKQLCHV